MGGSLSAEFFSWLLRFQNFLQQLLLSLVEGSALIFSIGRGNTSRGRDDMSFHDRGLSTKAKFLVMVRIILENILIAIEPITLFTDVGSCMTNLPGILKLYLSSTAGSSTAHDSNILGIFADEYVTYQNLSIIFWFKRYISFYFTHCYCHIQVFLI